MRIICVAAAALTLLACNKQQLAPDADPTRPELRVQTNGLWQNAGPVVVEGYAHGMQQISVNGAYLDTVEGNFTTQVQAQRGVTMIEAIGTDTRGDDYFVRQGILAGEFHNPDQTVTDGLTIRLNQTGIQHATQMVSGMIDPVSISSSVTALNPVYSDSYGVLGWDAVTVEADLVSVGFQQPIIQPTPRPGVLEVQVHIPYVEVHANVTGDVIGIDFDEDAWIGCDTATITANVTVDVQNGQLALDVIAPDVMLDGFWYDVSLIPGDVESYLLVDTLRGAVEGMLVSKLEEMLPPLLSDALGGLDIALETELLGTTVSISADFASASVDGAGIQLTTDVNIAVPPATDKPWAGYLSAPTGLPQPSMADDLGVSVSDNLLNNVLFQVWRGGMLNMVLDTADGGIDPAMLSQLGARDSARIVMDAQVPPVLVERNGEAQVQMTEMYVRIETPGGDKGEYLVLAVTAFVNLQLSIADGSLVLDLGNPDLVLDVRDSDWGADNNTITNLLVDQIPIQALLILLGDIEFPLPSVAGITVNNGDAFRETSGVYTSVGINL